VSDGSQFAVVDPAGIVVESVSERPAGLPLIKAGEASIGNKGFNAAVEVLLALPADLLARVDTIEATTKDDVVFTLAGGLQSVRWGSADKTPLKARVLATLVPTQNQAARLLYDVSAPEAPVVRSL
jgi:cell division protein FtsQ